MRKIGQSINEYVLVITLVTLAGIGMQSYIKRGIQGIVKTSADTLAGEKGDTVVYSGSEKSILPRSEWHPVATAYEKDRISGGFFVAEKTGGVVYYNHYPDTSDLENKIVIGSEDLASGDFTSYDWEGYVDAVYDKDGNLTKPFTPEEARADYGKYETVSLTAAGSKSVVQKGVIESGLVGFKQINPITINPENTEPNKKIRVETLPQHISPKSLAQTDWHPAMTAYKTRMEEDKIRGFIQTEVRGSKVYYYLFTTDIKDKVLIGGEDARTHDFTEFDPDGLPLLTVADFDVNKDGKFDVLRKYDGGYVTDPDTKEIVGIKDKDGNIYRKGEIVTIRPVPASTAPKAMGKEIRIKTIEKDATHTTGAWEATYKLGTDIYKPKRDPDDKYR